ncbi:translesion DNA synthesis-associated protein ImuA [Acidovorax sp. sic0104]|uniref:translesion DNA synthesis-associated protein ImuA n=1 Tax=Acidovorax sp. sic0104 TaxID=2854784 RepID=UPI001C451782|nr:translesion DNA synthesis-associated protein ImuA [Acidovorax sp. sic0104]MBV7543909.1 translesion DNA synthesis-associated protein ImuA [Acidovorax sp. sic0104]
MSALRIPRRVATSDLPSAVPGVWHADSLSADQQRTQPSGYALLDEQLPGGGWPVGALSEVLQPLPGLHEWQLVLPALAQALATRSGAVVGVAPPYEPFGPVLQARGLTARRLCLVQAQGASALWAVEQALRCRDVLAVMAWLPQVQPAALRRLQLAAAQQQQLLWVFRPLAAAPKALPALLRLQVQSPTRVSRQGQGAQGKAVAFPAMEVNILKRRGPPLVQDLHLPACHTRLALELAAQAARRQALHEAAHGMGLAVQPAQGLARHHAAASLPEETGAEGRGHALDRAAAAVLGG